MERKSLKDKGSTFAVGQKPRRKASDYGSITVDNQQDILLRRHRKAIAVFEKDTRATIESSQRLEAKRFLNNLRRSEMLLKEHESTKRTLFARHSQSLPVEDRSTRRVEDAKSQRRLTSRLSGSCLSGEESSMTSEYDDTDRIFSGKLKRLNDKVNVPYIKLNTYTKEDLKRPSTSLELKRKAWEKVSRHLEEHRSLRPSSADYMAKCERSVPRSVREAREKLRALTKVRLLAQLPPAPPRIDVDRVQAQRRDAERIEKQVVGEFCQSLHQLKAVLPPKFCWMDVNEVYLKNSEVQRRNNSSRVENDGQHNNRKEEQTNLTRNDCNLVRRRRRKGQAI